MRTEFHTLTRDDLEAIAKKFVKLELIGPIFYGTIGEQITRWTEDGGLEVLTPIEEEKPRWPIDW